jgi:hypothetical protein
MLSSFRTLSSVKSVKLHRALAGSAVAVAALAGSLTAWSAGVAAQPARTTHLTATGHPAAGLSLSRAAGSPLATGPAAAPGRPGLAGQSPLTHGQPPGLDAFLATAAKAGASPQMTSGHGKIGRAARLTPRQIARRLFHRFGWSQRQFRYLDPLWDEESSWNVYAFNAYSGAYGIPQALPGSKMASAGPHWQSSAHTQILWGLRYIKANYGSPRAAWDHELATGWY